MDPKIMKLIAYLLELASNEFSNHGCNDLSDEAFEGWTIEERQELAREYETWNGTPKCYDPECPDIPDWALMSFLSDRILNPKETHCRKINAQNAEKNCHRKQDGR